MEYGHYIETTGGEKYWFREGCTYCRMSTGGQHEYNCPLAEGYRVMGEENSQLAEEFIKIAQEVLPPWNFSGINAL